MDITLWYKKIPLPAVRVILQWKELMKVSSSVCWLSLWRPAWRTKKRGLKAALPLLKAGVVRVAPAGEGTTERYNRPYSDIVYAVCYSTEPGDGRAYLYYPTHSLGISCRGSARWRSRSRISPQAHKHSRARTRTHSGKACTSPRVR